MDAKVSITNVEPNTSDFGISGSQVIVNQVSGELYTRTLNNQVKRVGADTIFTPSGIGATSTRTVQDALRAIVRTGDYSTIGNFNTARDALTETIGVKALQIGTSAVSGGSGLTFPARTANRGSMSLISWDSTFNTDIDPGVAWGYNIASNGGIGGIAVAGEHALQWSIEGYYNDASGTIKMEAYLQYTAANGTTVVRPFFVQMDRTSNKVNTLQLKGDTVTFVADDGTANEGGASTYKFSKSVLNIYNAGAIPTLVANGGTNEHLQLSSRGNGSVYLQTSTTLQTQVQVGHTASVANAVYLTGGGTGAAALVAALGETNAALKLSSSGTGSVYVYTNFFSSPHFEVKDTASVTRWVTVTGSNGGNPTIGASAGVVAITGAPNVAGSTAITAGGADGVSIGSSAAIKVLFGSGAPTASAPKGSLYLRSDGSGTTDRAYINTNGTTTWTALTTVA